MKCPRCLSNGFRDVGYQSKETGERIEMQSCIICGHAVFPEVKDNPAVKTRRHGITLTAIVREFPDRIEGIKQENGWGAVSNWIKEEFGIEVNRGSLIASYCSNSTKPEHPADKHVRQHLQEIEERRKYGVGFQTISHWLREQTGFEINGKTLERAVNRVGRTA